MAIFPSSAIPSAADTGYTIDQSLRFNPSDSAYLSKTFGSGDRKTWTYSIWVKNCLGSDFLTLLRNWTADSNFHYLAMFSSGAIAHQHRTTAGGNIFYEYTTALHRDPSAWYHIVIAVDTTQVTDTDRVKFYVNGDLASLSYSGSIDNYPAEDYEGFINNNVEHRIGMWQETGGAGDVFDHMYIAEAHFIDGTALTPTSFGESGDYGEWKPKEYDVADGAYGTNGFYLDFANTSTIHTITVGGNTNHSTTQEKIGDTSIRFDGTDDYLTVPDHSVWDFGTKEFTIEAWVRFDAIGSKEFLFSRVDARVGSNWRTIYIIKDDDDTLVTRYGTGDAFVTSENKSTETFSVDTWYHIAVTRSGDDFKTYLDGVLLTSMNETSTVDIQGDTPFVFGAQYDSAWNDEFTGYMDEIRISNKCRYTANFTAPTTAFTDDDNTMLLIHSDTTNGSTTFTDSSGAVLGLGNDASTNSNNWTLNNISIADQMLDTPTNNFATWNPLFVEQWSSMSNVPVMKEGNLYAVQETHVAFMGTQAIKSHKVYFELHVHGADTMFGIMGAKPTFGVSYSYNDATSYGIYPWSTKKITAGVWATGPYDRQTDDIYMFAVDPVNNKMWCGKNGSWEGDPAAGTGNTFTLASNSDGYVPWFHSALSSGGMNGVLNCGQDSSFAGGKTAQGNQDANSIGDFYYTPPTDFLAVCTSNLPEPAVTPSEHFNTVTYSGDGAVTGVGFQPDFIWIKNINKAAEGHSLTDAIRGITKNLKTNNSDAEETPSDGLSAFGVDGFTAGTADHCGGSYNYVAWNWLGNGSGSANAVGSISSIVSANTDAGFSIVSWTGSGDTDTVGTGLTSDAEFVLVKNRDTTDNFSASTTVIDGSVDGTYINGSAAFEDWSARVDPSAAATSNTIGVYDWDDGNKSGSNMIAYCFHSVDGYSKVGSYQGNADADGAFIYTGFRPAFVIIKPSSRGGHWFMANNESSPYNVVDKVILANDSAGEYTDPSADCKKDFLSNGFKLRTADDNTNDDETYIYLAFAETPFKYSNAR